MDRSKGIGGTDIAAIIGLNPWKSAIDVYMEKLGLVEDQEDNESMWWGREMEPLLQKRYEQEMGYTVSMSNFLTHPKYSWYVGNPDGEIYAYGDGLAQDDPANCLVGGVDYKTTGYSKKGDWGEPGSDEVPPYYHAQAMWYMGLTGAKWWDIAVLFMGPHREFKVYRINRDDELIATLIEKGKDFWENHIIPRIPPPVDSSPGWDKYFKAKYPKEEEDLIEVDHDNIGYLWALLVKKYKEEAKEIDDKWAESENNLKSIIGNHAGIVGSFGKITWKKSKDMAAVDWQKAFEYLWSIRDWDGLSYGYKEDLLKDFTSTKPGPRIFRAYFDKDDE